MQTETRQRDRDRDRCPSNPRRETLQSVESCVEHADAHTPQHQAEARLKLADALPISSDALKTSSDALKT
eukprot:426992-Rhodomonas_salina.2